MISTLIKRVFSWRSTGNTTIEAAFVLPLTILVVSLMTSAAVLKSEQVRKVSDENIKYSEKILNPGIPAEAVLRVKYLGEKMLSEDMIEGQNIPKPAEN